MSSDETSARLVPVHPLLDHELSGLVDAGEEDAAAVASARPTVHASRQLSGRLALVPGTMRTSAPLMARSSSRGLNPPLPSKGRAPSGVTASAISLVERSDGEEPSSAFDGGTPAVATRFGQLPSSILPSALVSARSSSESTSSLPRGLPKGPLQLTSRGSKRFCR